MSRYKNSKTNETLPLSKSSRGHRLLGCFISLQLSVAASSLMMQESDAVQPVSTTEADDIKSQQDVLQPAPRSAKTEVNELPTDEAAAERELIINNLSAAGLELVPDPNGINMQEQFMVTSNQKCAVQFGVWALNESNVSVHAFLTGTKDGLPDPKVIEKEGTSESQIIHAENVLLLGVEFSIGDTEKSPNLAPIMDHLRTTTDHMCNLLAQEHGLDVS